MSDEIRTAAEAAEDAVLAHCHEVHAEGDATGPKVPEQIAREGDRNKSPARWAYERMVLYIRNFEATLDADHEVAMGFAGSEAGVLRIEGMGYFDPDLITFYGRGSDGTRMQLVQHVAQLSVLLRALPRPDSAPRPRRIGFRLAADLEGAEGTESPTSAPSAAPDNAPDAEG